MNTSYLFLADGFEEIEALTTVDVMRRAGMDVKTVAINSSGRAIGAHGIPVIADFIFSDVDFKEAEWLIAPGGMPGTQHLAEYKPLMDLILAHYNDGGKVAAICAAPALVLSPLGILKGKKATCYKGMEPMVDGAEMVDTHVVALDRIITGQGPAAATRFALAIVANSMGPESAQEVADAMLL